MEDVPGGALRIVASFAPHHLRVACLCAATRDKLRCGCSVFAVSSAASALAAWKLHTLAAVVCYSVADAVYHLSNCLPCSGLLLSTLAPGASVAEVDEFRDHVWATPLARAICKGDAGLVQVLLAARADLEGGQMLHGSPKPQLLPRHRRSDLLPLLQLDELERTSPVTQMTPLAASIQTDVQLGGAGLTSLLIQARAEINTKLCWCYRHADEMVLATPLIASLASTELTRLLISSRADVNGVQFEEKDCLDDYPGEMLTPLQYAKASVQQHRPKPGHAAAAPWPTAEVAEPVLALLREHHADALPCGGVLVAEGDRVAISEDYQHVLTACRAAGIGPDFDRHRLATLGKEAQIIQVDSSDDTVRVQVPGGPRPLGDAEGPTYRIWFAIRAVTILE